MIIRTYNQCKKIVNKKNIYVATDDNRIQNICQKNDINVVMTSKKCLTGTDRVAEVAKKIKVNTYINVQGDEPTLNPNDLKKLIKFSQKDPKNIINGYCRINKNSLYNNFNIPKLVFKRNGDLMYMSRAAIPASKNKKFKVGFRQVCMYAFPYKALQSFNNQKKKTIFEDIEDIEILRFIEMGYSVKMLKMSDKSISVDTKADLTKLKKIKFR